jgi:hypothetical protein
MSYISASVFEESASETEPVKDSLNWFKGLKSGIRSQKAISEEAMFQQTIEDAVSSA